MFSLFPPNPVARQLMTELPSFNSPTASLNLEFTSVFRSWPVFLIRGVKKRYLAFEIAILLGSIASRGSSSLSDVTFE